MLRWKDDPKYQQRAKERFLTFLPFRPKGGCWEWEGAYDRKRYGLFYYQNKKVKAHRLAVILLSGRKIPKNKLILHLCHNKRCCNPAHLQIGTHRDNILMDFKDKKRCTNGEAHPQNKLEDKDVIQIRKLYKTKQYTQPYLAKKFGVTRGHISNICTRKFWKHI